MASQPNQLHFVLVPLMSPGHLTPMVDMARLLAQHCVVVTIITTPLNASRFSSIIHRAAESGLQIQTLQLHFPSTEAGLPDQCENMDSLPSRGLIKNFYHAASMLQQPFEEAFDKLKPRPSCIVSGKSLPWTIETARKFNIPRIFFDGMGCFSFACTYSLEVSKVHENLSKFEAFIVPNLPHRIELTRAQLPENLNPGAPDLNDVRDKMKATELEADGIVVNTFEELETEYVKEYKRVKGDTVWCIGPVSACNKSVLDKAERGHKASIDENHVLKWLDSREPGSVVYASFGSISGLASWQLVDVGLGLEASNKPFIWVIRGNKKTEELEKWVIKEGFERRTKGRGLIIRGWAPQVLILSHPAIGGFLTHCGWNSTLEGVTSGVPIVTCPLFAEQFCNEKLVVEVLRIGVSVGVEAAVTWGIEEKAGLVFNKEQIRDAIDKVMDQGKKGEERRERARRFGEIAQRAIEEGGSSYLNMKKLIQFVQSRTTGQKSCS